jgi:hypothetical protein
VLACGLTIGGGVKLYLVSNSDVILKNTGFIDGSFDNYGDAFAYAKVGQYIHVIDVREVHEIVNAGKMAVKVHDA